MISQWFSVMGGILDRIESLSPQGKTYSVAARSNPDPVVGTESARQSRQWGRGARDSRQILTLPALTYRLTVQGEWESLIRRRSTLTLSKHNYGKRTSVLTKRISNSTILKNTNILANAFLFYAVAPNQCIYPSTDMGIWYLKSP